MPYQNVTRLPADVSCSLSLCVGLYVIEHLTTHWLPAAFKERLAPRSLRADEREKQRDEECHSLKDKQISHEDCNDGVRQRGDDAGRRRQVSLIKINHPCLVNAK